MNFNNSFCEMAGKLYDKQGATLFMKKMVVTIQCRCTEARKSVAASKKKIKKEMGLK